MKILLRYVLLIITLLCSGSHLTAQPSLHYPEKFTVADGLSSNRTTDILQDYNGFLWIGTSHGLNRYDGTEFVQFLAGEGPNGLADNSINRLIQLDSFHIAIATDNGLSILDTRYNTFQNKRFRFDSVWQDYDNLLQFMEKDSGGNLWIGTPVALYRLSKDLHLEKVFRSSYRYEDIGQTRIHFVYRIIPLSSGKILCWLPDGAYLWEPQPDTLIKVSGQKLSKFKFLAESSYFECKAVYNHYLIDVNCAMQVITVLDETTGVKGSCPIPFSSRVPFRDILEISELNNGWIALSFSTKGIVLIRLQPAKHTVSIHYDSRLYLARQITKKVIEDREGNFWMTTEAGGLYRIAPDKQLFFQIDLNDKEHNTSAEFEVSSFFQSGEKVFIASYGAGFYSWEKRSGKLKHYSARYDAGNQNKVWNFSLHKKDILWLGTQQGLLRYNLRTRHIGRIPQAHPSILDSVAITTQFKDSKNLLWMGLGKGNGVCVYDESKNSFHIYPNTKNNYPYRYPVAVAEDADANLWFVSDATANLAVWKRAENRFEKIIIPEFKGKVLVNTSRLYLDKNNRTIWYGVQDTGLVNYNISTGKVKAYGMKYGLNTNYIFSIVKDKTGRIWLATTQGISAFDTTEKQFINYTVSEGLPANYFSSSFLYDSISNIIYAGAPGKVVYFNPEQFIRDKKPLQARITGIKIDNELLPPEERQNARLSWKKNDVTISFTAVNLTNGKKNKYAYKLIGADSRWTTVGKQRQVRFASLNPGHYTFLLKAARGDGEWSPLTDRFTFTIRPPFVKTVWFYLCTLILLGSMLYSWYRYRLSNLMHIEVMRSRISHDLHDDIGSRLTNISMMSRIAMQEKESEKSKNKWLERIGQESEHISQSMREIVWSINPSNDSLQEAIPRMLRFTSEMLEPKKINVQAYIPDLKHVKIDMEKRRDLFLIFKEAIHNITCHAAARNVVIKIEIENNILILQLTDDGKGFAMEQLAYRNGLHYMQQRSEKNHWGLKITSSPGKGTKISLKVKLK